MAITRREFLQYSAATGAGVLFGVFDLKPIVAYAQKNPPVWTAEALSVGCYCSGGCGIIVGKNTIGGNEYVTYVQGNPDSPINKGALCSKCTSSAQLSTIVSDDTGTRIPNPQRLTGIKYRQAGVSDWDQVWDPGQGKYVDKLYSWTDVIPSLGLTAIQAIAAKVKAKRDSTTYFKEVEEVSGTPTGTHKGVPDSNWFIDNDGRNLYDLGIRVGMTVKNMTDGCTGVVSEISSTYVTNDTLRFAGGLSGGSDNDWDIGDIMKVLLTVNRCTGIGVLGGSSINNESAYLMSKLYRALGVVYLETQARN